MVGKPTELSQAETVLYLCERFGCLPSALYEEDSDLLRMVKIEQRGRRDDAE